MKAEPHFLLESLSRWDMGWRLSQTEGSMLMPVPQDFHSSVEAMHHVKSLSADAGCIVLVKVSSGRYEGPQGERIIEITQPAAAAITAKHAEH
jgi:hypothetical protein